MHPFFVLLHLAAAVMLLLWAVRMVRTGIERAYGPSLRGALRRARGGPAGMALAGLLLAIVLQSATAVGVLAAGFAQTGLIGVGAGLAALVGADLGSALVVKLLSFDLSELGPLLMLAGATLFLKLDNRTLRQIGRILLGISFILLSLRLVGEATAPLRHSAVLPQVAAYLAGDPVTAMAVAALLAWVLHSSVATLILFATFAANGVLPVEAAAPMVLGANIGGALVAVWLTRGAGLPARHIPLGNLVFRAAAAGVWLVLLDLVPGLLPALGSDPAVQLVNFHVVFNLALVVAALPLTGPMERLMGRLWPVMPETAAPADAHRSALDPASVATPALALASAQRELLRMGEALEAMLQPVIDLLEDGDLQQIDRVRARDGEVNRRHTDIKLFIADVNRRALTADEARRSLELASLAMDFEAVGDIIAKTLLAQAEEMALGRLHFSREGRAEIEGLHARVLANMQLALNVLVSSDLDSARQLAGEKAILRRMERDSHDRHLARLRAGAPETLATSDIHLEVVRALKEINSLLVKVAYPILAEQGFLRETRLVDVA
ncbi:Na/Pi cotransporter family protein [Microvirga tunisiensis]|uniref:Na/Pi cotransporter family protein n=1 Tax=Pannonibacter tanglangensis TaxID=2750084 RepID=A0A7X5J7H3_9HYPH|nr:Na/Pi cotransporter family protein [Pannonibacter sp. XCT-53]NBN76722.1 Na/Pi cotransporter family protein [Pannonibacter sp. XCT-53]